MRTIKIANVFVCVSMVLTLAACANKADYGGNEEMSQTQAEALEQESEIAGVQEVYRSSEKNGIMKTYYEMEDGLWNCDDTSYSFRLELNGRMPNAVKDSCYVVLTDNAELTFEDVSKSMFSSNFEDTKIMEGSVLVELR